MSLPKCPSAHEKKAKTISNFVYNISVTNNASTSIDNKVTWTVSASGIAATATLIAKYLVVQENERTIGVPVLATDITSALTLTPQTGATDAYKTYTAETPAPAITGNTATVYPLVTATKEGYETTNIIRSVELNKLP